MNPLPRTLLILGLTAFVYAPVSSLRAEENIAAEAKDKADSIMADPRLRNMLRTVKEDPAAALEQAKTESTDLDMSELDPDEAVRRMTKAFADNKDKIDPEKLKSAVATVKESGLAEKATAAAASVKESGLVEKTAAAVDQLAPEAAAMLGDVPATRPAPGISGGIPTPVAMPVEPGEAAPLPLKAGPSGNTPPIDSPAVAKTAVDAIAGAAPTRPMIPESPGLTPDEIPGPVPLEKKYAAATGGNYPGADKQHMQILSKESIMDNAKGILLFRGNVLIAHPEFEIKCDKLEIHLTKGVGIDGSEAGSSDSPFKRAVASGGMVEIKRTARDEKGKAKTQIAIARIAEYNAVTKDIILSGGPPYIQDGERFVKTNSEDARIIMRGNGLYEITGSGNRSQIVIPVEQKENTKEGAPGGKKKNETGIGSFGNAFDELR